MSKTLHLQQFSTARQTRSFSMRALNMAGILAPAYARPNATRWWAAASEAIASGTGAALVEPHSDAVAALQQLVDSINSSARLNLVGRFSASDDSTRLARNHLRIQSLIKSQPSILDTVLPPPIFIIGMPRTGTTYLHTLLAQDPRHRTIPYWESYEPIPPAAGPDTRIARLDKMLRQMDQISPNYQAIHPMTAESPEECVALFMNEFRTLQFDIQYRVPEYVAWLQKQDATIAYQGYLQQLKIIQHYRPAGEHFVLKDPAHTLNIRTILKVFPNAKFVFTHRDPAKSLSSLCSLYSYTRAIFSDAVDAHDIGREVLNGFWPPGWEDAMRVRDTLPADRYCDVLQTDMRESPVDAIRGVYAAFDMEFDETAQNALANYLEQSSSAPRHRHEHSPDGFGLEAGEIRERMQSYVDAFDL
ncbi:sulfotransferase [Pseudohalioglobus sediminis]|uniref:Sulfotransferase n=1 Tax=Pseudohalioglobus sediminis TaxID=2606449 RepID=A0A5B0WY75_9GAMM|nr:sulfotransferase [Pseudohalioglobus sediminis]KAA1191980.1 sulfotransferase [Pseudohalioglobus sediminis]